MAVYTKRLVLAYITATGEHVIYTCPPGKVAVVRDVSFTLTSGAGSLVGVTVQSGSAAAWLVATQSMGLYETRHWDGRAALAAGDELHLINVSAGVSIVVTGYEFAA